MDGQTIIKFNSTDMASSTDTSLSGFTGYEEELYNLNQLVDPNARTVTSEKHTQHDEHECCKVVYEARIRNLNIELQNALKLNEKYKHDLFDSETKFGLDYQDKINKFIVRNAQLEAHLEEARNKIQTVLMVCGHSVLFNVDGTSLDLNAQIELLKSEILSCSKDKDSSAVLIRNIQTELQEAKGDIQSRIACVNELKKKVSEQYASIENILQYSRKLENSLKTSKNDLDWCRKSETWYKEQLHACQMSKEQISEENINLRRLLAEKGQQVDALTIDANKWRNNCDEIHLTAQKERTDLMKKVDQLKVEVNNINLKSCLNNDSVDGLDGSSSYYETVIQDMSEEILKIKGEVVLHQAHFQKMNKENCQLLARITSLQKSMNEKEIIVQRLQTVKTELKNELSLSLQNSEVKGREILHLRTVKEEMEVKLIALEQEKQVVENTVAIIREDIRKIFSSYNKLKQELHEKENHILELQSEKQKMFMNNNWRICELESLKQNIPKMKILENTISTLKMRETNLRDKTQKLTDDNFNTSVKMEKLKETIDFQQTNLLQTEQKYKNIVCEKEDLIDFYHKKAAVVKSELEEKDKEINSLLNTVQEKDVKIKTLLEEVSVAKHQLQLEYRTLENERESLQNQLYQLSQSKVHLEMKNSVLKEQLSNSPKSNYHSFDNICEIKNDCLSDFHNSNNLAFYAEKYVSDILECICDKLFKLETGVICKEDTNLELKALTPDSKPFAQLQTILNKLYNFDSFRKHNLQTLDKQTNTIKQLKFKIREAKKHLQLKLDDTVDRCNKLFKASTDSYYLLKVILEESMTNKGEAATSELDEEIRKLKTLMKVQDSEMIEKLKRYEINMHTLLKKAKEHMKSRNSAEKQSALLQKLYDSLSEELLNIKLQINNRNCEIDKLRFEMGNLNSHNEKLCQSLFQLEKDITQTNMKNGQLEMILQEYRISIENFKQSLISKNGELESKNIALETLNMEKRELIREKEHLVEVNTKHLLEIEMNSSSEKSSKTSVQQLQAKLSCKEKECLEALDKVVSAEAMLKQNEEQKQFLTKEVQILNNTLQEKTEVLQNMQLQQNKIENEFSKTEMGLRNTITSLRFDLQDLENELNLLKNDKYFLQRLCSDLKYALQSSINQGKILKERIFTLSENRRECSSLPDLMLSSLPSPSKYDDSLVNKLLQQSVSVPKPLNEVQGCLNSLKEKLNHLQKQINEKSFGN